MDPLTIIGGVSAGAGLLGSLFGGANDYDPERRALKRFYELTNPNSSYFKQYRALYGRMMAEGTPTIDTLTGLARTGGVSGAGASAIAARQGEAMAMKNREGVSNLMLQQSMQAEQLAQGYLGLEYQRAAGQAASRGSFYNQLLTLGGGTLMRSLLNQPSGKSIQFDDAGNPTDVGGGSGREVDPFADWDSR